MPQSTKEITRRIKSVANTKKITKAMELVSAAKMKKSVEATLASRFYAHYSWDILINLAKVTESAKHPLLNIRPIKKIAVVLITSDKGLCGSYNAAITRKIIEQMKQSDSLMVNRVMDQKLTPAVKIDDLRIDFICLGKKGAETVRKLNKNISEVFTGIKDRPKLKDIKPISSLLIGLYSQKKYDKVVVAYTNYDSPVKQEPKIRQLLPISKIDLEKIIEELDSDNAKKEEQIIREPGTEYVFEPNQGKLLDSILPKLVEMQLYQMIMESSASEHSARMLAMKNASDAASDMISELTLIYNKARQAAITQEIAEISSGKAALEE